MATPWLQSVKDAKKLTVFDGISEGNWGTIFVLALQSFNKFSKQLGVKLIKAKDEATANIVMRIGDGTAKFEYDNTSYESSFSATGLHGKTHTLARNGAIEKAFIFLPARPEVDDFDGRGKQIKKVVSQDVRKIIAVHELIHASGLDNNSDHGGDGIFYYPLAYQEGKLYVPEKGKNRALMPPIRIGATIMANLKKLWV